MTQRRARARPARAASRRWARRRWRTSRAARARTRCGSAASASTSRQRSAPRFAVERSRRARLARRARPGRAWSAHRCAAPSRCRRPRPRSARISRSPRKPRDTAAKKRHRLPQPRQPDRGVERRAADTRVERHAGGRVAGRQTHPSRLRRRRRTSVTPVDTATAVGAPSMRDSAGLPRHSGFPLIHLLDLLIDGNQTWHPRRVRRTAHSTQPRSSPKTSSMQSHATALAALLRRRRRLAPPTQPVIGLITKTETNPFFVKMKEGAAAGSQGQGRQAAVAAPARPTATTPARSPRSRT